MSNHYDDATLDDARAAIQYLDPTDFDTWFRVGAALRLEFGDMAFETWDSWSTGYPRYSAKETRSRWARFRGSSNAGTATMGTVFKWALDRGWKFTQKELTTEQRRAFAVEQESRRRELEAQRIIEDQDIEDWYMVVANASIRIWEKLHPVGRSPYLGRKKVGSYGVRFAHTGMIIHTIESAKAVVLIEGKEAISEFFATRTEDTKFHYIKPGYVIVPLRDSLGQLFNLQMISETGKKMFMRNGRKQGLFHFFGEPDIGGPIGIAEGYATAASAYMARNWPMVVAFDAGNLPPVAEAIAKMYPTNKIFILADNDSVGIKKGGEAALVSRGCLVIPHFPAVQNAR
jgi:putative DNA primase/helicase